MRFTLGATALIGGCLLAYGSPAFSQDARLPQWWHGSSPSVLRLVLYS
jgi:hypothetical protein